MTTQKSFKRLVRARMEKTQESYTAARAALLAAEGAKKPPLATSDANIRRRTGRGWEEWFDLLDAWGAPERSHRDTARWIAEQQGIEPLAWNAQAIAHSYELARGLRAPGEHADGFRVTVTRTIGVPVQRLYDAFTRRGAAGALAARRASCGCARRPPRGPRASTGRTAPTRLHLTFAEKDAARSTVSLAHVRLADAQEAERMKAWWRERLAALRALLEG